MSLDTAAFNVLGRLAALSKCRRLQQDAIQQYPTCAESEGGRSLDTAALKVLGRLAALGSVGHSSSAC